MTDSTRSARTTMGPFALLPDWLVESLHAVSPGHTGSAVLVWWSLHHWVNHDTGQCWPSLASIGKRAGLARTTTWDGLDLLQKVGALTITERPGSSSLYTLNLNRPESYPQPVRQNGWVPVRHSGPELEPTELENARTPVDNSPLRRAPSRQADIAWARVWSDVSAIGRYGDRTPYDPATEAALATVGGFRALCDCSTGEQTALRWAFLRAYTEAAES